MLWGPSFLFIKVAVAEISPITLVFTRVALAAGMLYLLLRLQKHSLPPRVRVWIYLAIVAFFQISFPWVLLSWAEQFIDSASASILNALTPIFTVILAHMMTTDDKITATKAIGILLGLLGSVFLVAPVLMSGVQATTLGLLAMIVVTASYGLALVLTRKHLRGMPSVVGPTSQLLLATLFLVPLVILFERPFGQPLPSLKAAGSVLALAVFGTTLAFIVYYRLIETADASYASLVAYVIPIFGILLGVLVLDERLGWNDFAGFVLIVTGVMIVNGLFNIRGRLGRSGQLRAKFWARLIR